MNPSESGTASAPSVQDLAPAGASLEALLDVSMPVVVEMGRTQMTVQDVLQLGIGSIVQLDRLLGEPVDLYVSNRRLAFGEVVVVGEHFGVRITRVSAGQTPEGTA